MIRLRHGLKLKDLPARQIYIIMPHIMVEMLEKHMLPVIHE